jgi:hypothetical protein
MPFHQLWEEYLEALWDRYRNLGDVTVHVESMSTMEVLQELARYSEYKTIY